MRRFTSGTADARKIIVVELQGATMVVSALEPDGSRKRTERQFSSGEEARSAVDKLARELVGRGFKEHGSARPTTERRPAAAAASTPPRPSPSPRSSPPVAAGGAGLLEALADGTPAEPVLKRLAPTAETEPTLPRGASQPAAVKEKKKKKKKKRKADPDALDKRVLAAIGLVGALVFGVVGFIVYDQFIKPPSIVGTWRGSMTEHEISKYLTHTSYDLILDESHNAALTINKSSYKGTYSLKGNRLKLTVKSEESEKRAKEIAAAAKAEKAADPGPAKEAEPGQEKPVVPGQENVADPGPGKGPEGAQGHVEEAGKDEEEPDGPMEVQNMDMEFKVSIGRRTLDLIEPATNKLVVQLIRFDESNAVAVSKSDAGVATADAPKDLAAEAAKADPSTEATLTEAIAPKDGAFRVKYPKGWKTDTGSRPDNTYSWISLENGSAKVAVYADIQGSLMSGSDSSRHDEPEGSESAPVHRAHEFYVKTASEEYSEYKESKPVVIKATGMGEGRIAVFNAAEGGILGSTRLRGYHVTFLSRDRRVSIICRCSPKDFARLKPTFLAICRAMSR